MNNNVINTYAAYYKNDIRLESSSGGLFSLIASKFDVVYGVAMTEDCYECKFVRLEGDIAPIRGSKYFQAKVGDAFKQVKKDLLDGKSVLFTGTGCQINGLSMFLGKEYSNLFLLDIICHGVPSPKLWKEYVLFQEKRLGKIVSVNFRNKDNGWKKYCMKKNHDVISMNRDSFMKMFIRNYSLRPSCYECHAKKLKKADMTLGDFWGIEYIEPDMDDDKGTSLVIIRTEKGKEIFESLKSDVVWKEVTYEKGVKVNPSEYQSSPKPKERDSFFKNLDSLSFEEMEKIYAAEKKKSISKKIKDNIWYILRRIKRLFIKKK